MLSATYVGPKCGWNVEPGLRALVRDDPGNAHQLLVQFNDFHIARAGVDLAFGWHAFPRDQFKVDSDA